MKTIKLILIFVFTYFGMYTLLSAFGMLLCNYSFLEITRCGEWFAAYFLFIGWWVGGIVCYEFSYEFSKKLES